MTVDSEIASVIEDLLRYPELSILFVGAGAGIPSPTNLPGGADVSNHLLYHLCEGIPEAFDSYFGTGTPALGAAPTPLLSPLNDVALAYGLDHLVASSIRFETLLYCGWLKVGDRFLNALDCLHLGCPNVYHKFAARFLELGGTVITTNFDTHIEKALSPAARVSVIPDWPDSASACSTLFKLHGSLSSSSCPVPKSKLGATLRRVMAPPRDGQLALRRLLERAVRVVFVGYSFSDHFDITSVLREASFRHPIIVLEYGSAPARVDPTSYLSLKLSHLLTGHRPLVYLCDAHVFFSAHIPLLGVAPSGPSALEQLAGSIKAIALWQRSQILAELLIFLGYYGRASALLASSKPPVSAFREELARHCLLTADVLSDTRSQDTIALLVDGLRYLQKFSLLDFEHHLLRVQLELALAREHLRHRHFTRALLRYALLDVRTYVLMRTARTDEERENVLEISQIVQTYSGLIPGSSLWKALQPVRPRSTLKRTAVAPDVALLELLRSPPSSVDETISVRLVLALELMNLVAAYMILRDSVRESDVQRAVLLADSLKSCIGKVSARLKLARLELARQGFVDAAKTVDEAIRFTIESGRLPTFRLLIARRLCRLLAVSTTSSSRYFVFGAKRVVVSLAHLMLMRSLQ